MSDSRYQPLFMCKVCREDYSKYAEDLHVLPNGDLLCHDCGDYTESDYPEWDALPRFVPEADATIERLRRERDEARAEVLDIGKNMSCRHKRVRALEEGAQKVVDDVLRAASGMDTAGGDSAWLEDFVAPLRSLLTAPPADECPKWNGEDGGFWHCELTEADQDALYHGADPASVRPDKFVRYVGPHDPDAPPATPPEPRPEPDRCAICEKNFRTHNAGSRILDPDTGKGYCSPRCYRKRTPPEPRDWKKAPWTCRYCGGTSAMDETHICKDISPKFCTNCEEEIPCDCGMNPPVTFRKANASLFKPDPCEWNEDYGSTDNPPLVPPCSECGGTGEVTQWNGVDYRRTKPCPKCRGGES